METPVAQTDDRRDAMEERKDQYAETGTTEKTRGGVLEPSRESESWRYQRSWNACRSEDRNGVYRKKA